MIHLLSTQSLIDQADGRQEMLRWSGTVAWSSVEASTISFGQAIEAFTNHSKAHARAGLLKSLELIRGLLLPHGGVVPYDYEAAVQWARIAGMDLPYRPRGGALVELSRTSRMVVATALARGVTLVEAPQPYHAKLPGLKVANP